MKLQEKPLQILETLLERPGELVTRKELRETLWPDTFVGFDRSLNTAVNCVRKALGDAPANPRFLETKFRQGYRFIAPAEPIPWTSARGARHDAAIDSIAVLPFHNATGDPEMEYLSDGLSETLIDTLSQLPEVRVMARSTVFRYKDRNVDPQIVGQDLNVRALLTGTVRHQADTLTIGAELVDTTKGWRLWGERYHRKFSEILTLEDEISREIAQKLRLRLTTDARARLAKQYTGNPQAYQDYLRGRYHSNKMTQEGLSKGITYFERAIQGDPHFALPYAGLSDSYILLAFFGICPSKEVLPKAEETARKALEIDPNVAEAHASLAGVLKSHHWDWVGAEKEYQSAIALNPNYAAAHRWYADFLAAFRRTDEAIKEMGHALELDPLSLIINMELAWIFYMARDHHRAADQALRTLDIEPKFSPAFHVLGLAYAQLGKHKEAAKAVQKAYSASGGNPISLAAVGHVQALAGRKAEARKILKDLKDRSKRGYIPPYVISTLYLSLREIPQGLDWIERACEERDAWLIWVLRDPRLDSARSEPRFLDILRRMNLPA